MKIYRKIISIVLTIVLLFGVLGNPTTAQAASYPHITDMIDGEGKDIPYFKQVNDKDCGIPSIAMIEAYSLGYNKSWYQAFYEGVFQANIESGKSPSFSINKVLNGYKSIKKTKDSDTLENIYNQLKKGNPVLIYRTGGLGDHWSVVVAYQGSTSKLEKSGFLVYNTGHFADSKVHTMNLEKWLSSGADWVHAYVRDEGAMSSVTKNVKTITLENIYYPKNLKTGSTFASTGLVISGSNLTKVEVGVKTKGGTTKFSDCKTDLGRKYYGLMNFDSKMKFSTKLSAGTYIYYVNAKNEDGNTLKWTKEFTVSSSALSWGKTTYGEIVPTKVTLNKASATITKSGGTVSLTSTVSPSNATYDDVTWKSSNTNVAKVNSSGKVTAVGNGTATITATTVSGKKTATCKVTVSIAPTGVTLDKTSATLTSKGQTLTLKATVAPSNAANKNVTWKSSDTSVAKVNSSGKVTAVGNGTATITVTTAVGSKKATCKVTVSIAATGITLDKTSATLAKKGDTITLTATVTPSNAVNKKVTWKSSNTSVATVNSSGKVTAVGAGTATITATAAGGSGVKATCTITVKEEYKDGLNLYTDGKLYYFKDNKIDTTYNGVADYKGDTWYVKNGKVDTSVNGLASANGNWYLFKEGKVNCTTTLVYYGGVWWYVANGQVNFNYDGVADYNGYTWYIENGRVDFSKNGLQLRSGTWYLFNGGKVNRTTTLSNYSGIWWYVSDGEVDFDADTLAYYNKVWWYIEDGKVDFKYDGVQDYNGYTWYIENGRVDFNKNGLQLRSGTWYLFNGGKVNRTTTLANYGGIWWYVSNGEVDFDADTLAYYNKVWWYIEDGKVDFKYDGVQDYNGYTWYVENGKVDFTYNGSYTDENGIKYKIVNGKVM